MQQKQLLGNVSIWWPVAFVLFAAVLVIIFGIWGGGFVAGNTDAFSNAVRSLQWETMAAGLFGLAGGLAVIVAMRRQIEHSEKIAQQQRQDFLLADINAQLADIELICAACLVFTRHAFLLISPEQSDEMDVLYISKIHAEDYEYPIRAHMRLADRLVTENRVPMQIEEAFEQVVFELNELWRVVDIVSYDNIPRKIENLESAIEVLRGDLISYRKRMLEFRMV